MRHSRCVVRQLRCGIPEQPNQSVALFRICEGSHLHQADFAANLVWEVDLRFGPKPLILSSRKLDWEGNCFAERQYFTKRDAISANLRAGQKGEFPD